MEGRGRGKGARRFLNGENDESTKRVKQEMQAMGDEGKAALLLPLSLPPPPLLLRELKPSSKSAASKFA